MPSVNTLSVFRRFGLGLGVTLAAAALGGAAAVAGAAAAEPAAVAPCDTPEHHQFDFWLGEWRVYDGESGRLVATDRIEKRFAGCVVEQDLSFLTDMYRRPGVAYRLSGTSVSRFDGQQWLQLWADNQWGAIVLAGAPDKAGAMVLTSAVPSRGRDVRLEWRREPGGVVRISQYVAAAGSGQWQRNDDLIYRPVLRRARQASAGASTPCRRSASTKGARCSR